MNFRIPSLLQKFVPSPFTYWKRSWENPKVCVVLISASLADLAIWSRYPCGVLILNQVFNFNRWYLIWNRNFTLHRGFVIISFFSKAQGSQWDGEHIWVKVQIWRLFENIYFIILKNTKSACLHMWLSFPLVAKLSGI